MIKLYALNYGVNTFLFLFNSGGGGGVLDNGHAPEGNRRHI